MGGVGANLVVEEVFEGSGGVIAVSQQRLVLYKSLMSFGRKGGPVSGTGLYKYDAVLLCSDRPLGIMELLIW